MKRELELNAYLDLVFPKVLENDPNTVAIWTVGPQGAARYYPNIGLGNILPPDNNPTKEIFYTPATPENDPERKVTWSILYDDPAGNGLMITATAPIYTKQKGFIGVVGIDVTLNNIVKNIEEYTPIDPSYSFLIDKDGYSIALPDEAYKDMLGRSRETRESRVDLNNLTNGFSSVITKMRGGSTGFQNISIGNKELFVAYAPLKSTGFSLGIVVEKAVLLKAVGDLQKDVGDSTHNLIYLRILPIGLLILLSTLIVGFLLTDRIVEPIKKLTKVAVEISNGNFNVKADATSNDELGQLASSFNQMAWELGKSRSELKGYSRNLEEKVAERTGELDAKVGELNRTRLAMLNMMEDLQQAKDELDVKVKERTKELQKAYDDIREADKVKDDFLAITSHELKTPLTSILGLTQLIQEELKDKMSDDEKEDIKIVLDEANRLRKLIEEILELARLDAGKQVFHMVELDMKKVSEETVNELKAFSKQHNMPVKIEEMNVPTVTGDLESVKRLLYNLINNSIKYTSERHGDVAVGGYAEGGSVVTYVRDTGIGIPDEAKPRIFTRFYQVDTSNSRKYGGTGLGLAICKKIVEAHGGRIWFDSKLGEGSTFYFSLPIFNKGK